MCRQSSMRSPPHSHRGQLTHELCGGWCAVEYSPFYGIEKGAVLQEARIFNDPHIDPRRCQQVRAALVRDLYVFSVWQV